MISLILLFFISSNLVGAANLSGSIRFLNDIGITWSACNHFSEKTFIKYYGGRGSKSDTKKFN